MIRMNFLKRNLGLIPLSVSLSLSVLTLSSPELWAKCDSIGPAFQYESQDFFDGYWADMYPQGTPQQDMTSSSSGKIHSPIARSSQQQQRYGNGPATGPQSHMQYQRFKNEFNNADDLDGCFDEMLKTYYPDMEKRLRARGVVLVQGPRATKLDVAAYGYKLIQPDGLPIANGSKVQTIVVDLNQDQIQRRQGVFSKRKQIKGQDDLAIYDNAELFPGAEPYDAGSGQASITPAPNKNSISQLDLIYKAGSPMLNGNGYMEGYYFHPILEKKNDYTYKLRIEWIRPQGYSDEDWKAQNENLKKAFPEMLVKRDENSDNLYRIISQKTAQDDMLVLRAARPYPEWGPTSGLHIEFDPVEIPNKDSIASIPEKPQPQTFVGKTNPNTVMIPSKTRGIPAPAKPAVDSNVKNISILTSDGKVLSVHSLGEVKDFDLVTNAQKIAISTPQAVKSFVLAYRSKMEQQSKKNSKARTISTVEPSAEQKQVFQILDDGAPVTMQSTTCI